MLDQTPSAAVAAMGRETFAEIVRVSQDLQQDLVRLSTQGRQIMAGESTHNVHWDQPDLVSEAIREMVEQLRGE